MSSGVSRGAEGEIRPGLYSEGKTRQKKRRRKVKREKRRNREKEKMGETCIYSNSKLEYLSCGAPMHV